MWPSLAQQSNSGVTLLTSATHTNPSQEDEEQLEDEGPSTSKPAKPPAAAAAAAEAPGGAHEGPSTSAGAGEEPEGPASKRPRFSKLGKDPGVATNFLPDKAREEQEKELRAQLKRVRQTNNTKQLVQPAWCGSDLSSGCLCSIAICSLQCLCAWYQGSCFGTAAVEP